MYGFSKCKPEKGMDSAFSNPHFTRDYVNHQAIEKRGAKGTTKKDPIAYNSDSRSLNSQERSLSA